MTQEKIEDTLKSLREAGAKMTAEDLRKQAISYARNAARLDGADSDVAVQRYAERALLTNTTKSEQ